MNSSMSPLIDVPLECVISIQTNFSNRLEFRYLIISIKISQQETNVGKYLSVYILINAIFMHSKFNNICTYL